MRQFNRTALFVLLLAGLLLPHGPAQAKKCEDYPEGHPTRQSPYCQSQLPPKQGEGLLSDLINLPNTIVKDAVDAVRGSPGEEEAKHAAEQEHKQAEEEKKRDAERRALEKERRRTEEAKRAAEQERKRFEEERKREAERRALEEERRRMEEAKRAMEQERKQVEEERKRAAEQERERVEEERKREAERRALEEERRRMEEAKRALEQERERVEEERKREAERRALEEKRLGVQASKCVSIHWLSDPHHPKNPYGITYIQNNCSHDVEALYCSAQTGKAPETIRQVLFDEAGLHARDCKDGRPDPRDLGPVFYAKREVLGAKAKKLVYQGKHALQLGACALQDGAGRFHDMATYVDLGSMGYAYERVSETSLDASRRKQQQVVEDPPEAEYSPGQFYCDASLEERQYKRSGYGSGPDFNNMMVAEYLEEAHQACLKKKDSESTFLLRLLGFGGKGLTDCGSTGRNVATLPAGLVEPSKLSYVFEECLARKEEAKMRFGMFEIVQAWARDERAPYELIDCKAEQQAWLAAEEERKRQAEEEAARLAAEEEERKLALEAEARRLAEEMVRKMEAERKAAEEVARRKGEEARRKAEAERKAAEEAAQRMAPGRVFREPLRSGGEGPEMVVLPAGSFRMGCLSNDDDCQYDEEPVHEVQIARPFAVSVYEVTFEEYDRFTSSTGRGGSDAKVWGRGRRPVINVSWLDAQAYVSWLSEQTGAEYRLLSESEWEYAARAGSSTKYSWGNAIGRNRANCVGCGSQWDHEQTAPVGSFEPNGFGLHDMHGNVTEWVADCYIGSYQGAPTDGSAWTWSDCEDRVLRGGSWYGIPAILRSAFRGANPSDYRADSFGFRVARTLTP